MQINSFKDVSSQSGITFWATL